MTWILHSLSSLNLFKSWQFMLYYSTLLVLIIRLKPVLHEINWNFKIKTKLFSRQLKFSWVWDGPTSHKCRGAMQETKLCSIHILKPSDGCAQGPEALAKYLSVENTLWCEICSADTELPVRSCVWAIAFCQDTIMALFGFLFLKVQSNWEVHRANPWDRSWISQLWEKESGKEMEEQGNPYKSWFCGQMR